MKKVTRKGNDRVYYNLVDENRVNGKLVAKYVGYLRKDPNSKRELEPENLMSYVKR